MEMKYDRQKHNRTYYEKNSENIKRKQREKRAKMKAALQQLEAENQEIDIDTPEPEPVTMGSKFFLNISDTVKSMLFKAAISGSLVASQAVYRALRKTIENKQSNTQSSPVISSNPLD